MLMFPADEQRISDVERGRSCRAVVPMPAGAALAIGDAILFAHSQSGPGQPPAYVKDGDCVAVTLTDVMYLDAPDSHLGPQLVQIAWNPLGQGGSQATTSARTSKRRPSGGKA
jgi:hypothetical protein